MPIYIILYHCWHILSCYNIYIPWIITQWCLSFPAAYQTSWNVPGSKWRLLSNVLARVGKSGETAANWSNSRPWIGLFQGVKCNNVSKCNVEFAWGRTCTGIWTSKKRAPRWYSDLYSVWGNPNTYPNATILLRDRIYMRVVSRSQPHSPEERNVFPRCTYAAHHS